MKLLLILTVIFPAIICQEAPCQNVILYGDRIWYKAMSIFRLKPELYNGKVQYEDDGELFYLRHRDGQWQLVEQVDPSWFFGFAYGNEDYPYENSNLWTFIDYEEFNYHPNRNFKVECAEIDPRLWLRDGVCTGHAISSATSNSISGAKACFEACLDTAQCVGFSVSREGCTLLSQICLNTQFPTTGGVTYVLGKANQVLDGLTAQQSTTNLDWNGSPEKAIDGTFEGDLVTGSSCSLTLEERAPWWMVQLGQLHLVKAVAITNRDDCCSERLLGTTIAGTSERDPAVIMEKLNNSDFSGLEICGTVDEVLNSSSPLTKRHLIRCSSQMLIRSFVIYKHQNESADTEILSLCEVELFAEKVDQYVYMDAEKVTKSQAQEICASSINGTLVHIDSNQTLDSLISFIAELQIIEDVWIGNSLSPTQNDIGIDLFYEEGEIIFNAASPDDGATCTASSSLPSNACRYALDNDYMTSWAMLKNDADPWIQINFRYYYNIFKIQLAQRRFSGESFKDVELEFSEGQTIVMTLEHRQGESEDDATGHMIDVGYLDGLVSKSVKITALDMYTSKNNGFTDIKMLGRPKGGLTFHTGECIDGEILDIISDKDVFSCDDLCLSRPDCISYTVEKSENVTCVLLSQCSGVDASLDNSTTVILRSDTGYYRHPLNAGCGLSTYVGWKNGLTPAQCMEFCEDVAECVAWTYDSRGSCQLLRMQCAIENMYWDGTYYYERIGGSRKKINGTYVGCFTDDRNERDFLQDAYLFDGEMTMDLCRSHCQSSGNYSYLALQGSTRCSCDWSYGKYGLTTREKADDECWNRCLGDSKTICGGYGSSSIYSIEPIIEECTSIQTYDGLAEEYGALFKKEICELELYFICQKPNDFCDPFPCEHGGTCISGEYDFICQCPPQYEGIACEKEIDECLSSPCLNGGTCGDLLGRFSCICAPGYVGAHCETDFEECLSEPCQNNATCLDGIDGFICQCDAGFTGANCETESDECSSNPCGPFGQCLDYLNGFSCICQDGFQGLLCDIDIDECTSNPCQNNGTCTDRLNSYICDCQLGTYGDLCEQVDDHCLNETCSGHGVCQNELSGSFCVCDLGWTGQDCAIGVNDCVNASCENDATCVDGMNNFTCLCHPGFSGFLCEFYMGNPSSWGKWSDWSECSVSCGSGLTTRKRNCIPSDDQLPLEDCGPDDSQTLVCGLPCPEDGANCTRWSGWSGCQGTCQEAGQRRTRTCQEPDLESQTRTCKPSGCKKEELSCYKCGTEISGHDDVSKMTLCPETEKCGRDHTHCVYEYDFSEKSSTVHTRCGNIKECSSVKPGSACYSLFSLFFLGEAASAEDVMGALHKTNSSCTICCTTPKCNEGYIPFQDVLSSTSSASLVAYHVMHAVVLALICLTLS